MLLILAGASDQPSSLYMSASQHAALEAVCSGSWLLCKMLQQQTSRFYNSTPSRAVTNCNMHNTQASHTVLLFSIVQLAGQNAAKYTTLAEWLASKQQECLLFDPQCPLAGMLAPFVPSGVQLEGSEAAN